MLHEINSPTCAPQFEQIVQFQGRVLAFACDATTTLPLDEQKLVLSFGQDVGGWLGERLWKRETKGQPSKSSFHKALEHLIRYVTRHPSQRRRIMEAFNHDIEFHLHLTDTSFEFWYRTKLSKKAQSAVRGLMKVFYTELLMSGFPAHIHGYVKKIDRDVLIAAFWEANQKLEVCPACDAPKPDAIEKKVYADADHFLPKTAYPFLAVHPTNLVPLCVACNRSFKGDRDPLEKKQDALVHSFHPYTNPAVNNINVEVSRDEEGVAHVHIVDQAGMPSRRVANMNRVFKLEGRWEERLPYEIRRLREHLADSGRRLMRGGRQITEDDVRDDLQGELQARIDQPGQRHNAVLQIGYLSYGLQNTNEFAELYAQYIGA